MHVMDSLFHVYTSGSLMVGGSNDAKSLMHCGGLGRLNACCVELQLPVYLYECIFAVHSAVITLAEYLNVLLELLSLRHAHDATPLIVYLHSIHVAIGLLFLLPFNQPQPVDQEQAQHRAMEHCNIST